MRQTSALMSVNKLEGDWRVEREGGLLPPFVSKRIGGRTGWTFLAGLPVGPFRVAGTTLDYLGWPIRDELTQRADGSWEGRGLVFGREFCRFRLVKPD